MLVNLGSYGKTMLAPPKVHPVKGSREVVRNPACRVLPIPRTLNLIDFKDANVAVDLATKADVQFMINDARADIIKWVAGMLVAQSAVIAALVKLL